MNFFLIRNSEETKLTVGTPLNLVNYFIRQLILSHDFAGLQIPNHEVAVLITTRQENAIGTKRYCSYTACMEDIIYGNSRWEWF